jgi:hypothetical protein
MHKWQWQNIICDANAQPEKYRGVKRDLGVLLRAVHTILKTIFSRKKRSLQKKQVTRWELILFD